MTDQIAYTILNSAWVAAALILSRADLATTLFINEENISNIKEFRKERLKSLSWLFMHITEMTACFFVIYVWTTGTTHFNARIDAAVNVNRFTIVSAALGVMFANNLFMGIYRIYMFAVLYDVTVGAAKLDGGFSFMYSPFGKENSGAKTMGKVFYMIFVAFFLTFLFGCAVIIFTNGGYYITWEERGISTQLLFSAAIIMICSLISDASMFYSSEHEGRHYHRHRNIIAAGLKRMAIPLPLDKSGSSYSSTDIKTKSGYNSFATSGLGRVIESDHPYSAALTAAHGLLGKEEAKEKAITADNLCIRKFAGVDYALNKQTANIIDNIAGANIARHNVVGYNVKSALSMENFAKSKDEILNSTSLFPENAHFWEHHGKVPLLFDYDLAAIPTLMFTHKTCGVFTGESVWVHFEHNLIIPFFMFLLPFYINFLFDTENGIMLWIITAWFPLFASLRGRFGEFWGLFSMAFVVAWVTIIGAQEFLPNSELYIFNKDIFTRNGIVPGVVYDNNDTALNVTMDASAVYYGSCITSLVLACLGFSNSFWKVWSTLSARKLWIIDAGKTATRVVKNAVDVIPGIRNLAKVGVEP